MSRGNCLRGVSWAAWLLAAAPVFPAGSTIGELKRLDVEALMNVEVTSVARQRGRLLDAAAAIQVITREDIRRSGATNLPEALRLADNLQVAQRTSAAWAISARGFNTNLGNKLLVMIDGRTVYTPLFSGVFWEGQDYLLEDVERIEVISGPGGTLWGANAVNGVINVITRDATDSRGLHLEAAAGNELQTMLGARQGGTLGTGSYRVYGKYSERDAAAIGDGSSAKDDWHRSQGGFRFDSAADGASRLTVQGDYYYNHEHEPNTGDLSILQGANLLARWTRELSPQSQFSLQTYYDWTGLSDAVPPVTANGVTVAPAGHLQDDLQTFDVDFQHQLQMGARHGIVWGLGFRFTHDVVRNAPGLAFIPERLDQQLYSAFAQDEIRLREDLWFTLGTKVEHNDYTGWEFEPSVRLRWQPAADQTVWAAVSRAIRAPSRIDRDLRQPAPPYPPVLYGSSTFNSEELLAWELGYRARRSDFTFSLAAFYNDYDNVRSTTVEPPALLPMTFANGIEGDTWGLEFSGDLQLSSRWSLHLGYNLLEEDLRVKPGELDVSGGRSEMADPEQQATLRSAINLPGAISVDAALRWVDTLHIHNRRATGTVPHYLELNLRVAWQATPRLELALAGQNLLHDQHPEYGFPGAQRVEIERSLFGTVTWRQ
jgi:iron complex outermembrane receptor protein